MTRSRLPFAALLLVLSSLLAGCKPKSPQVPEATPAPAIVESTPASEAECKDFAKKVESAVAHRNRASLDHLFALEDLVVRCLSDLSMTGSQRQSIVQGVREQARKSTLAAQILADVEQGGSYKLLRVHEVDGRFRALFRLIGSDSGVAYHDFILVRSQAGRVISQDIYLFTNGELVSQSLRRILLPAVAELNKASVANLRGADRTFLDNLPKFLAMGEAMQAGNKAEGIKTYKTLPKELREQKAILLLYLSAAEGDDAEYTAAMESFRRLFPADPALDLVSIDYFRLKKQYDDALKCIDRADRAVGGDPYQQVLRANVLIDAKRYDEARSAAAFALEKEPTLAPAYWSRILAGVGEKNHPDTLLWLKNLVEKTGEEVADLTSVPEYAEFVKSPQHAEWLKWYSAKKKK